jgi:UDP-GlcNAc:undecaprenyl-phosphate/decaprenyl-phosphate GlcNAc-1-phosphate transferase
MIILVYVYLFILTLIISINLVPVAGRSAVRFGIVDKPHERKIHREEKPLLGGFAIYFAFIISLGIQLGGYFILKDFAFFIDSFPLLVRQTEMLSDRLPQLLSILAGATIMLLLGFIDDRRGINFSFKIKFAVQFLTAVGLVFMGIRTEFMPTDLLNGLVTVFWIVGITNAFNLLDNMDGLAGGVAIIAAIIFTILTAAQGQIFSAMIFSVFAGSLAGFVRYNFPPAKIFMGDAGSLFIGFILASLAVTTSYVIPESPSLLPVLIPVIVLGVPIFDMISVVFIRFTEGRPVFIGDRRHLSHRLVDSGMTQRGAVLLIYLTSAVVGSVAILLPSLSFWNEIIALLFVVSVFVAITIYSRKKLN